VRKVTVSPLLHPANWCGRSSYFAVIFRAFRTSFGSTREMIEAAPWESAGKAPSVSRLDHAQAEKCAHLAALLESTRDLIWSVDLHHRLVTFNKAFVQDVNQNFQRCPQAGMLPSDVFSPGWAAVWPPLYQRALTEGPYRAEFLRPDGRCCELSFNEVWLEGEIIGVSVFSKDITERKLAAEFRKTDEGPFRTLVEQAPSAIVIGRNGFLIYVNQKFVDMFGVQDPAETLGKPLREFWTPDWQDVIEERHRLRCAGVAVPSDYEAAMQRKDGTRLPVHVAVTAVELADGPAVLAFISDISARMEAEEALRQSDARFRSSFNLPLIGMAITSSEKRFIEVNHRLCEILGYRREELVQMDWAQITLPDDLPSNINPFNRMLAGEVNGYSLDKRFIRKDGQIVYTTISVACVHKPDGTFEYACLNVQDISERTRAERALHASLEQTIEVISETVDQRDPYTAGHQRRVADLCVRIGEKLGLDSHRTLGLRLAATIHDLGKIGIPAEILVKPGPLTPIQFELIKEHARLGHDIVKTVSFPWPIADIILQHHERLDGSGYPQGLRGDAILLEARILAVADAVEATGSHRPYRAMRGIDSALSELLGARGTLFDPDAVDACVTLFREDGYAFPS
jgi:PAS domain S-box-containing protein